MNEQIKNYIEKYAVRKKRVIHVEILLRLMGMC